SSYGLSEGNQLTTATFLAEERLEQVKNAPWMCTATPCPNPPGASGNDCVGVGPAAVPTVPPNWTCTNGAINLAAGAVTFADEPMGTIAPAYAGAPAYTNYSRTVRIQDCGVTPCMGITDAGMRQITVTVNYNPITANGGAAGNTKAVTLTMLVARR